MENDTSKYGLKVVNPKEDQFEIVYQHKSNSYEKKQKENKAKKKSRDRQNNVVSIIDQLSSSNEIDTLGIWSQLRTPNEFGVRAQQALEPFDNIKEGDSLTFFDIEALGTPEHLRKEDSEKFFAMTELSFKGTHFKGVDFALDASNLLSIAVKPTEEVEKILTSAINKLENNKGMVLSKDMERSLLDLTKYSDPNNFVYGRYRNGRTYTEITGHAKVWSSGTAITDKTIAQMRAGLNNLMDMGTPVDAALSIFKDEIERSGSKITGYNIHHYDVPSLISSTSNQTLRNFFQQASSSSLDHYHSFSAVTETPYTLIGGSAKQEHAHKHLSTNGDIIPIKGEGSTYFYHLAKDDILASIDLGGFSHKQVRNYLDNKANTSEYLFSPTNIDKTPLKVGDTIFSYQSGFFDEERDKYNLIGRQLEDGKVEPRWSELDTSIPTMESFRVDNFFEDVSLSKDKKGYGVRLSSTEENSDKVIYLFSETKEDLAQQIHGRFMKVNDKNRLIFENMKKYKRTQESPANRYKNVVEEGGFDKFSFLVDVVDKFNKDGKITDSLKEYVLNHKYGSAELLKDIPGLSARLTGEKELWQEVLSRIGNSGLTKAQRDVALRHFKQRVDELGDNKGSVTVIGGRFKNFEFNKNDTTVFSARSTEPIKNAFRNYIRTGRAQERTVGAEVPYQLSRINELQEIIQHNFNIEGPEADKVKKLTDNLRKEVRARGKIETALTEIANYVRNKVELVGTDTFERELMSEITEKRKSAIGQVLSNISDEVQNSINHAKSLHEGKVKNTTNKKLLEFLTEQDQRIVALFDRNFGTAGVNSGKSLDDAKNMVAKYKELVENIVESYSDDFDVSLQIENGNKLYLTLQEKGKGIQNFDARTKEELRTKTNAALIELPSFDDRLTVSYDGQRKASLIKSGYSNDTLYHSTTVTDALNIILHRKEEVKELIQQEKPGYLNTVQSYIIGQIRKQVDPITTQHNRRIGSDEAKILSPKSEVGMSTASAKWDLSGFSEEWYRSKWLRDGKGNGKNEPSVEEIRRYASDRHMTFFEALGAKNRKAANQFLLESIDFAKERTGLQGSAFGITNADYGRAIVGTIAADPRRYNAFGNYYADAGENQQKTRNYRPLEEHRVERVFGDKTYRYQNSLISSDMAELRENVSFVRGIQTQSGYMTDHEIATRLKNAELVRKLKEKIDADRNLTKEQKRTMKSVIDSHMLSSTEGLGFMDYKMFEAYNANTEKRISFEGDNVEFSSKIEKKIEEALISEGRKDLVENQAWKQTTFSFDKPIEINVDDLINERGKTTVGIYTRGTIIESLEKENSFRRGDKATINGFSGDGPKKTLVLGREDEMGHGLKIVTEGGQRITMVPMPKYIIEDIYGQEGVEQVIMHLPGKKGANDLAAIIRGYETNIRQQLNGEITTVSDWVKEQIKQNKSENDILEEYYKDVRESFGLNESQLYMKDGISIVSSDLGYDGEKHFTWDQRTQFIEKMNTKLGMKRVIYGDVNFAHDVPLYQGGVDRGRYTLKEIEMLSKGFERAIGNPGQQSELTKYLLSLISGDLATPETQAKQRAYREMLQAAESLKDGWTPSKNDIVIDYTTDGPGIQGDVNAVKKDGVLYVGKDNFKAVPKAQPGAVLTVQDYIKTIIKAGDESIQLEDGYEAVISKHLYDNKALAYLKLPEEVGAKNQFVPLIDVSSMSLPIRPEEKQMFTNAVQAHYARIDRLTNEYSSIHVNEKMTVTEANDLKRKKIDELIRETEGLRETFAKLTSSDGMADIVSRRMPMSSHFQYAGVNGVLPYYYKNGEWHVKNGLDEGTKYMNRESLSNLIGDKAENIVKTWDINIDDVMAEIKAKNAKGEIYNLKDWALDNWNKYDTYSVDTRYPSIHSSTSQVLKLKILDGVGKNQVMGLRGAAARLNADNDGDNIVVSLAHYDLDNDELRKRIVKEMAKTQEYDAKRNKFFADLLLDQMKSEMEDDLIKHVLGDSKKFDDLSEDEQVKIRKQAQKVTDVHFSTDKEVNMVTVGDKAMLDAFNATIQSNGKYENWGINKVGEGIVAAEEHINSLAAHAKFQFVGSVDKVRMLVSSAFSGIALQRYNHFGNEEGPYQYSRERYNRETAMVDEFLREFSQQAISSKKTDLSNMPKGSASEAEIVAKSLEELSDMINQLSNPNSTLTIGDMTKTLIEDMGLYKDEIIPLEIERGVFYKNAAGKVMGKDVAYQFVEDSIKLIQEAGQIHREVTGRQFKAMHSIMLAASQGMGSLENISHAVLTGEHIPGQVSAEEQKKYLSESALKRQKQYEELYSEGVQRVHRRIVDNQLGNREDRLADNASVLGIMNPGTRTNPELVTSGDVTVYRTIRSEINDTVSNITNKTRHSMSSSAMGMMMMGAAGFASLWAGNVLMGKTPTPEGVAQAAAAPVNPDVMQTPTARITPNQNGEYINIQVKASNAKNLSPNNIAAMINTELMAQSGVTMNQNVMVSDNSRNIDQQWLQGAVYNTINKGYAY